VFVSPNKIKNFFIFFLILFHSLISLMQNTSYSLNKMYNHFLDYISYFFLIQFCIVFLLLSNYLKLLPFHQISKYISTPFLFLLFDIFLKCSFLLENQITFLPFLQHQQNYIPFFFLKYVCQYQSTLPLLGAKHFRKDFRSLDCISKKCYTIIRVYLGAEAPFCILITLIYLDYLIIHQN